MCVDGQDRRANKDRDYGARRRPVAVAPRHGVDPPAEDARHRIVYEVHVA